MGRGQQLLNLVKSIKQEKELQTVQEEIKEVIKPENLKAGVTAFGVEGNKNVVDTQSANLNGYYLKPGYSGYAKGEKITGSATLFNSSNPTNLYGTQTIINPESPNFILTHQYSDGTIKGKIITIPNSTIPSEYIEGKNICIRAGRWGSYYQKQWRVEIAVCDWGNQFFFKNSGGAMCLICKGASGNPPYVLYTQNVDELNQLTSTGWTKKEVASSNYMTEGLGRYPETYCYSRDNSWPAGSGLTRSSGVPGSIDKIYVKNIIGVNTTTGFVDSNANIYNVIQHSTIANAINLKPEDIKKGSTYLGVEGIMEAGVDTSDATVVPEYLIKGITAYANGEKITGTLEGRGAGASVYYDIDPTSFELYPESKTVGMRTNAFTTPVAMMERSHVKIGTDYATIANAFGITSDQIAEGSTVIGIEGSHKGLDTSDATATTEDIITGKTAYVNGKKVTGTLGRSYGSSSIVYSDNIEVVDGLTLRFNHTFDEACAFPKGSYFNLQADIDSLLNAIGLTADKIKAGETILGITGTYAGEDSNGVSHNGGTN